MLSYEEFKEALVEKIKEFLPENLSPEYVELRSENKVNGERDSIAINRIPIGDGCSISPSLRVEEMYKRYCKTEDLEGLAMSVISDLERVEEMAPKNVAFNRETIEKKAFCDVINYAQNEELLETVPHREFGDLAVVYRAFLGDDMSEGIGTAMITNEHLKSFEMTEEELNEIAMKNTKSIMEPNARSMNELLRSMLVDAGRDSEEIDEMMENVPLPDNLMYVVTNRFGCMGSNAILFPEYFEPIAEKLGSDLYILPSSRHELIAVSVDKMNLDEAIDMVFNVNMTEVELRDRLSNQIYKYDSEAKTISCVTDTIYKRIDGKTEADIDKEREENKSAR